MEAELLSGLRVSTLWTRPSKLSRTPTLFWLLEAPFQPCDSVSLLWAPRAHGTPQVTRA